MLIYNYTIFIIVIGSLFFLDDEYCRSTTEEKNTCEHEHIDFRRQLSLRGEKREDGTSKRSCDNLGYADCSVEKSEVGPDMSSLECVSENRERKCEHGSPCTSNEEIADEEQILVVHEIDGNKSHTTQHETECIDKLPVLEERNDDSPDDRTHRLNGKKDSDPVACILILL